jgi:hypothetical protein
MPLLDTQKITDDLVAAGVGAAQARIFASKMEEAAHVIRGDLATKSDIEATRADVKAVTKELQNENKLLRVELRSQIKDMTNRFTFIVVAVVGLAVAVLKLWQ